MKHYLENVAKIFAVLNDACKFVVVAALSVFVLAAMIFPTWAQDELKKWNLVVKQVNIFGITLASAQTFDMAKDLSDVKLALDDAEAELQHSSPAGAQRISNAVAKLNNVQASLKKQSETLQAIQKDAGIQLPAIPDTGWLYVGLIARNGKFFPDPGVDTKNTLLRGQELITLTLRGDSRLVANGDCPQAVKLEDIKAPTLEDLQTVEVLINGAAGHPLDVLTTKICAHGGETKSLWAQIRIRKEDVKFAKFETLLAR